MQQALGTLLSVEVLLVSSSASFSLALPSKLSCLLAQASILWSANSKDVCQASEKEVLSHCCGEIKHPEENYGVLMPHSMRST